jgi:hypothetical protein
LIKHWQKLFIFNLRRILTLFALLHRDQHRLVVERTTSHFPELGRPLDKKSGDQGPML